MMFETNVRKRVEVYLNSIFRGGLAEDRHDLVTFLKFLATINDDLAHSAHNLLKNGPVSHITSVNRYIDISLRLGLIELCDAKYWRKLTPQARYYRITKKGKALLSILQQEAF